MKIFKLEDTRDFYCDGKIGVREIEGELYIIGDSLMKSEIEPNFKFDREEVVMMFYCVINNVWYDFYYSIPDDTVLGVYNNEGGYLSGCENMEKFKMYGRELREWKEVIKSITNKEE